MRSPAEEGSPEMLSCIPLRANERDAAVERWKGLSASFATTAEEQLPQKLQTIAVELLESFLIVARNSQSGAQSFYVFRELEIYPFIGGTLEDNFTHRDAQQALFGTWYFHKKGGTFKGGSFKGLDVTFGSSGSAHPGAFVGILIRSIHKCKTGLAETGKHALIFDPEGLVEGPSLVVDELLQACGKDSIAQLVGAGEPLSFLDDAGPLSIVPWRPAEEKSLPLTVRRAPRVGLIPRELSALKFSGRLWRLFSTFTVHTEQRDQQANLPTWCAKSLLAKHRCGIIAATALDMLRGDGQLKSPGIMDADELAAKTGGTKKNCQAVLTLLHDALSAYAAAGPEADSLAGKSCLGQDVGKPEVIVPIVALAAVRGWL
jgi:hypothetical protein